jgi:hypothetical protein
MPYHEPDPTDPTLLVGTEVGATRGEIEEMATAFAAELAQLGHTREAIVALFRTPAYAGPNLAWRTLGEARLVTLVEEAAAFWGRCRVRVEEPAAASARIAPQLLKITDGRG